MNRTPRLSKSGIEYLDYSWGIYSGCHNHLRGICGGGGREFNCWAQGTAYRFPNLYPDGFNPHYYPEALDSPKHLKKPSIIGVGWVGDVIGYGLDYKEQIYSTIEACPQHTFLFLTKNPENIPQWSPFPDNCWVGVTATDEISAWSASFWMGMSGTIEIKATVKYLSIEPLLKSIDGSYDFPGMTKETYLERILSPFNQVIIGAQTKPYKPPEIEWVGEIIRACDKAGTKVFLKDNLSPLIPPATKYIPLFYKEYPSSIVGRAITLRQEMPK